MPLSAACAVCCAAPVGAVYAAVAATLGGLVFVACPAAGAMLILRAGLGWRRYRRSRAAAGDGPGERGASPSAIEPVVVARREAPVNERSHT